MGEGGSGRFVDQVAVVTGGASGIGEAVCERLHEEGARVVILDRNEVAAGVVAARLGGRAASRGVDVSDPVAVRVAVDEIVATLGRLDLLVNNAGITRDHRVELMTDEAWDAVLAVNLTGAFAAIRASLRHMVRRRAGRIINIASVVGIHGEPGQANYAASKGGLISLTLSVAREAASRGITANAIAPGLITTPLTDRMPPGVRDRIVGFIPLRRPGRPVEIAAAVAFLASAEASYITGQVLTVDGGLFG